MLQKETRLSRSYGGNLKKAPLVFSKKIGLPYFFQFLFKQQNAMHTWYVMEDVDEFLTEHGWTFKVTEDFVSDYVVAHIRNNMRQLKLFNQRDEPWWTITSTCTFSVKSALELLRHKEDIYDDIKLLSVNIYLSSSLSWLREFGKVKF